MTQSKASVSYSALCAQECKEIVKMFWIVMWLVVTDDAIGSNKGSCKKRLFPKKTEDDTRVVEIK